MIVRRAAPLVAAVLVAAASVSPRALPAQGAVAARLASADAAWAAGDRGRAEREYAAVVALDPSHSRAVFRLAQLRESTDRASAIALYRRYVQLEGTDPWGHMALGNALAGAGRATEALAAYDAAERLAPRERDVHVGRARVLARTQRTDAAIAAYERWLAVRPGDAEARRELETQRRRAGQVAAGPNRATIEPRLSGSRDSDGLTTLRTGAVFTSALHGGARFLAGVSTGSSGDGSFARASADASAGVTYRPLAQLRLEGSAGVVRADRAFIDTTTVVSMPGGPGRGGVPIGRPASAGNRFETFPVGRARIVWRVPGDGLAIDARTARQLLDASPFLVAQGVLRDEAQVSADARLRGPLRARGFARVATIHNEDERNGRQVVGGALAWAPGSHELTLRAQAVTYDAPTALAYFAPRYARTVELTSYVERETAAGSTFAFDVAAGVQQVTPWAGPASSWSPGFRGWAQALLPVSPRLTLGMEVEAYDSRFSMDAPASTRTDARWRYGAGTVSLRVGF